MLAPSKHYNITGQSHLVSPVITKYSSTLSAQMEKIKVKPNLSDVWATLVETARLCDSQDQGAYTTPIYPSPVDFKKG